MIPSPDFNIGCTPRTLRPRGKYESLRSPNRTIAFQQWDALICLKKSLKPAYDLFKFFLFAFYSCVTIGLKPSKNQRHSLEVVYESF
jgi:hypothetical protein